MRCAVFDIGSNSIKLLLAERKKEKWKILYENSHSTRLAENLATTGKLEEKAIERTLKTLKKFQKKAEELGATRWAAVATSAVRDSKNRKEFLKLAREKLGFSVQLLSGNEEAEIIFAGVAGDPYWKKDLVNLDIGGGSAEWIEGKKSGKIQKRISLPLGCVRLRERFIKSYPVKKEVLSDLLTTLEKQVEPALTGFSLKHHLFVATGGTITTLAAMNLKLKKKNHAQKVDHSLLLISEVEEWLHQLASLTLPKIKKIPALPSRRADLMVPGIALLLVTMKLLGARQVRISVRGLRYGILETRGG